MLCPSILVSSLSFLSGLRTYNPKYQCIIKGFRINCHNSHSNGIFFIHSEPKYICRLFTSISMPVRCFSTFWYWCLSNFVHWKLVLFRITLNNCSLSQYKKKIKKYLLHLEYSNYWEHKKKQSNYFQVIEKMTWFIFESEQIKMIIDDNVEKLNCNIK